MKIYKKNVGNVFALFEDRCSAKKAIETRTTVPMLSCASDRFNLSAQEILDEDEDLLVQINELI